MFEIMMSRDRGVYNMSLDLLESGSNKRVSAEAQGALALRHFSLFAPLQAIAALQERGMIKIMTPDEWEREQLIKKFMETDRANADQFKQKYNNVTQTSINRGTNLEYRIPEQDQANAGMVAPVTERAQDFFRQNAHRLNQSPAKMQEERATEQERLLFLAERLGAIGSNVKQQVRDGVIFSIYNEWLASAANGTEQFIPRLDEYLQRTNSPLARTYTRRAMQSPSLFAEAFNRAKFNYDRRIVGKSLSFAMGGRKNEKIDFLLNR